MNGYRFYTATSLLLLTALFTACQKSAPAPQEESGVNAETEIIPEPNAGSEKPQLTVAISVDIAPYVMKNATTGIEVDIATQALPGYQLNFVQMPYEKLQSAVAEDRADMALGVQKFKDVEGIFYSDNFIDFVNAAITKKSANLKIEKVADLADHKVLTWQDAYLELGPEFEKLFAPDSPQRKNYVEVADQSEQVKQFWDSKDAVIVIDRSIFNAISQATEHKLSEVDYASIFPEATYFKANFEEADIRDAFNAGLKKLCSSGEYDKLLKKYNIELPGTICDSKAHP
ncbi:MAG: amino acid ABC transporter [Gimesia sp.]|uniref:Amino acid ABC transporter n=1 Tax=Gimesia maris TaxID=122 RepID=A0A3D3R1E8_9PLAN|nr:amino acid ABC transporter [Gimesia sp.]HCO22653.1 amino acid ABC transporter [Gimesia maris]|tara:strand:- start:82598 stop:83458 length:861 start_codon:yes stop_codon:yes gene_type:complete